MNEKGLLRNHQNKVNRIYTAICFFLSSSTVIVSFLSGKHYSSSEIMILMIKLLFFVLTAFCLFREKYGFLVPYLSVVITVVGFLAEDIMTNAMSLILSISLLAMYLDSLILLICSISMVSFQMIIYLFKYGWSGLTGYMVQNIAPAVSVLLILFFITKWGRDLIIKSAEKEKEAKGLLNEIENDMKVVKESTNALNANISFANNSIISILDGSQAVSSAVQEMAGGILEQTDSITNISQMVDNANSKVYDMSNSSKRMNDISIESKRVISEGAKKVELMEFQMDVIKRTSAKSYGTVQELNQNVDEISSFLDSINRIAQQTNLLSLNAAIEAARAGESGKGFTVVAEEVRKLAEESANTVKTIHDIISKIKEKTKAVMSEVNKGQAATEEGGEAVNKVKEGFNVIKETFEAIDNNIADELTRINKLAEVFARINHEAQHIAVIAQQSAASTEELVAIEDENNRKIVEIRKLIQNIKDTSTNLQELIK